MNRMRWLYMAVAASMLLVSCNRTPENVLGREAMASLMADIQVGEAVIDLNYAAYPNDSTRKALKQSVYVAHGVDQELVDTSLAWYGNHIEEYIKVCDRTIEILQERQRDLASASNAQMALAGDSVAIWTGPGHIVVSGQMPSRIVSFNLEPDSTWQKGDIFVLRYTPVNATTQPLSRLMVDYSNGVTGYVDDNANTSALSPTHIQRLQVDSTLTPLRVYGYITLPEGYNGYEVDSISVVRMRHYMMPNSYMSHKRFNNGLTLEQRRVNRAETEATEVDNQVVIPPPSMLDGQVPARTSSGRHQSQASQRELPGSSSEREQTEHRKGASEHKATPESRRAAANRRMQAPSNQRRELKRTQDNKK